MSEVLPWLPDSGGVGWMVKACWGGCSYGETLQHFAIVRLFCWLALTSNILNLYVFNHHVGMNNNNNLTFQLEIYSKEKMFLVHEASSLVIIFSYRIKAGHNSPIWVRYILTLSCQRLKGSQKSLRNMMSVRKCVGFMEVSCCRTMNYSFDVLITHDTIKSWQFDRWSLVG